MKEFDVYIVNTQTARVTVEADTWEDAEIKAEEIFMSGNADVTETLTFDTEEIG